MRSRNENHRALRLLVGSVLYQGVWFAAVYSAGHAGRWWWGVLAALVFLAIAMLAWKAVRARVIKMTLAALACGLVVDTVMIASQVLSSERMLLPAPLPPLWLLMLWAAFGVYIALSLEMLYGRYRVTALVGALGGLVAYRGGSFLGALTWGEPAWRSYLLLMLAWALAFPALVWMATRLQRAEVPAAKASHPRMRVALM